MVPVKRHGYEADFKLQAVSQAVELGNRAESGFNNCKVSKIFFFFIPKVIFRIMSLVVINLCHILSSYTTNTVTTKF